MCKIERYPSFEYRDKNNHLCRVEMENATRIVINVAGVDVVVTAARGYTPKTYYSGNQVKGRMNFSAPEGVIVEPVDENGGSNADAHSKVIAAGCQIVFDAFGAGCSGLLFLTQQTTKNELGSVTWTERIQGSVSVGVLERASVQEYLSVIVPTGNLSAYEVLFSGWRRPNNLVEGEGATHEVRFLDKVSYRDTEYTVSIPYAQSRGAECSNQAAEALVKHLNEIYSK